MSILDVLVILILVYVAIGLAYFVLQEAIIFRGKGVSTVKDYRLTVEFEEVVFNTPDNGEIHSIFLFTREPCKGVILYLHGNTGHLKRWAIVAQELVELGYDICVPDYRGYGKSKGPRTEETMHNDITCIADRLLDKYPGQRFVVFGRSLGTGFAVRLAAGRHFDGLILETPFFSLLDVAKSYFPWLPMAWLLRYPFRSDRFISEVNCPILILHGTKDRVVPYRSAYALYSLISNDKNVDMVTIPGANHNNLNAYPVYWGKLKTFLQTNSEK